MGLWGAEQTIEGASESSGGGDDGMVYSEAYRQVAAIVWARSEPSTST